MTNFNIEIVSDNVCPWCYVGKRRLERGIEAFKHKYPDRQDTFATTFKPFYLNPDAPKSIDKQSYYFSKFGEDRTRMIFGRLAGIGKEEGIAFKFGGKTGNTRDSHRLVQLGKTNSPQMQTKVVEQLFRAYFEEERDITSHEVLLDAGIKAGLHEGEVKALLESDQQGDMVDREVEEAQRGMIAGVPHFTIEDAFEVSGAQEPETFVQLFEQVLKLKNTSLVGDRPGNTC